MKKLNFLVSLTNNDNDYQQEQAAAAEKAARTLGVEVNVIHANNDAVAQSQQLLQYVQGSVPRPDAIMFEPAGGTGFPQVARAAAAAGIGWVVLNHEVDYIQELRRTNKVPISPSVPIMKKLAESKEPVRSCCQTADRFFTSRDRPIALPRRNAHEG